MSIRTGLTYDIDVGILSDGKLKIKIISMLRTLMEKIGNVQEQMGNVGKKWKH